MSGNKQDIALYPFPSESTEDVKFRIYEMKGRDNNKESILPHFTNRPHRHDFYEIAVFYKGGGTHEIDFSSYPIEDRSIYFIAPGGVHLITRQSSCYGYLIIFNTEFYNFIFQSSDLLVELPYFQADASRPFIQLDKRNFEKFNILIKSMLSVHSSTHSFKDQVLGSYLNIFLLESCILFLDKTDLDKSNSSGHKLVVRFKKLINSEFRTKTLIKFYADKLSISSVHLNNTVKKVTGKSASDHLKERRVLEAKRLLSYTDKSVKEIAYLLNFEDPSHFNRFFKKHSQTTPNSFRQKYL